jgi:orotidine-5'-phosphate decarboxylase
VAPGLVRVVPGIRPAGSARDDQARVASPAQAIEMGADVLVLGRAVTRAPDPLAAARAIAEEVASALDRRAAASKEPGRASPAR